MSAIDMRDAIRQSEVQIRSDRHGYICVADVHSVMEAFRDPEYREIINGSWMTTPDGMPLVWMGRLQGQKTMRRVYGPDFLLELCRVSVPRGYRHFFYGGKTGVAEELSVRLQEKFPGLHVVGSYAPPFRPLTAEEEQELLALVEEARPDVFWVGLGAPKQERFMAHYCKKLPCKLMVGIGAAFDIHSGALKEAPRWLHRTGLQWLYRLTQEPQRLWRRYLNCVPAFLWNLGLQACGLRRARLET